MRKYIFTLFLLLFFSTVCLAYQNYSIVRVTNEREDIYIGIVKFNRSMTSYRILNDYRLEGAGKITWKLQPGFTYGVTFYNPVTNTIIAYTNFIPKIDHNYILVLDVNYNIIFDEIIGRSCRILFTKGID